MGCGTSSPVPGGVSCPSAPRHISQCALSLAFLVRFAEEHALRERGLTTKQVVDEVIKPATAAAKCRYTDTMQLAGCDPSLKEAVSNGRAFFFISHTWGRRFTDTLDMVVKHFALENQRMCRHQQKAEVQQQEDVFVWFDMFAVNQHQVLGTDDNSDLMALWEVVRDARETLMVLDVEGSPLTRIWCLYEAWQSSKAGPEKLRLLSYDIGIEQLRQVFIDLDVSKAEAFAAADRDRILEDIRRDVGSLDKMTHTLKDALVAGAVAQLPPEEEDVDWDAHVSDQVVCAADLCQLYGRLPLAEALTRRDLAANKQVLGAEHLNTLRSASNLAVVLQAQGKYDEAEPLHRQALAARERVLGAEHPTTLSSASSLAVLLQSQGKADEAELLYRRTLVARERVLGAEHPSTISSVNSLACLLNSQCKYDEAEPLHRRAMVASKQVLGAEHPLTLITSNQLANLLMSQGKYDEAEPLHRRALAASERVLGTEHPDTLSSVSNLACLLELQGKYDEAEPLFHRAMLSSERTLGADHPTTLTTVINWARLLKSQGRYDEAERLYRRALAARERVLGAEHPHTLTTVNNLAVLLHSQGRYDEAEPLYRQALAARERVLGAQHPDTLNSVNNLANLLRSKGQYY